MINPMKILLKQNEWEIGQPLAGADASGFATVYEASDGSKKSYVAKFVPKEPGAEREILINDSLNLTNKINVIPIVDSGEHEEHWVLIMPKAEVSLAQYIQRSPDSLTFHQVISILLDIVTTLEEIGDSVVHRDLKPQNILLYEERWCLADFGIARYAEASTDAHTHKYTMTKPYAAPEQWNMVRATQATDIYALGVIAYQLVTGILPFPGPDYRSQHLTHQPPAMNDVSPRLRSIIEECLYKSPEARPTAANLRTRLEKADEIPSTPARASLAAVNQTIVSSQMQKQMETEKARQQKSREADLLDAAEISLKSIVLPLREIIMDEVPSASFNEPEPHLERLSGGLKLSRQPNQNLLAVSIQGATLKVSTPYSDARSWGGPFEVIANAQISVERRTTDRHGWAGRSHSLWYCDAIAKGHFGWYEVAFMQRLLAGRPMIVPYAIVPHSAERAFQGVIGDEQIAWPLTEIDRDDPEEFVERWAEWLAQAATGSLSCPSTLPEKATPRNWRQTK